MKDVMHAAVLTGYGGPDRLEFRDDVPVPSVGPGQVLIEVTAASVNNTDIWTRQGAYGMQDDADARAGWRGPLSFPRIQGGDICGRISKVGEGVDRSRVGQRVLVDPALYDGPGDDANPVGLLGSERDGGFADYIVVEAARAHDVDDSPLSDAELACLPIAYGTAMGMLERGGLLATDTTLVTGASGGVGLALVQLAAARGATVIALTSGPRRAAVEAAGAGQSIDRAAPDLLVELHDAAPAGFDVVLDVVGGRVFEDAFGTLREGGRWVIAGAIAGPVVRLDLRRLYLHQRRIIGSSMHTPAHFRRLVEEARRGSVRPVVDSTYALRDIHEAQQRFESGGFLGKLVVQP